MAFHDVDYDAYCILGDPHVPALWNWLAWKRFSVDQEKGSGKGVRNRLLRSGRQLWRLKDQEKVSGTDYCGLVVNCGG
jgi:hypothetical protein